MPFEKHISVLYNFLASFVIKWVWGTLLKANIIESITHTINEINPRTYAFVMYN